MRHALPIAGSRRGPIAVPLATRRATAQAAQAAGLSPRTLTMLSALLGVASEQRLSQRALARFTVQLARALDAPILSVRLLDATGRWLVLKASVGMPAPLRRKMRRLSVDSTIGRSIAGRGRRVVLAGGSGRSLPPWPDKLARRFGAGAFVPIRAGRTVLGALGIGYHAAGRPPASQIRFLDALGRQFGATIETVRERAARRKIRAETLTLRKITAALGANLEPRAVLDMVTSAAAQLTHAAGAIVLLRSRDRSEIEVASQSDAQGRVHLVGLRFPAGDSLAARVMRTGRSYRSADALVDRRPMIRALLSAAGVRGLLIVPLRTAEGAIGALAVSAVRPRLFSDRDRRILVQLGQQAALAIQNARLFDAVRSHRQVLRQLYSQQFSILEDERKRIAHELHDEMGPTLSATLINLQLMRTTGTPAPGLAAKLADTERLLRSTIEKVRELAYGLRPPMLEHLGLAESVRWMITTYFTNGVTLVDYRHRGPEVALDPGIALAVYRIAQEALTNVVKHARAARVSVRLRLSPSLVTLRVCDDGVGFDASQAPGRKVGLGIASMRERMEHLGGRMEIRSAPGRGCRLTISCPVEGSGARALG